MKLNYYYLMIKKTLYLAVDKNCKAHLFEVKPVRIDDGWDDPDEQYGLMTITIPELIFFGLPHERTWNDDPLQITITIND